MKAAGRCARQGFAWRQLMFDSSTIVVKYFYMNVVGIHKEIRPAFFPRGDDDGFEAKETWNDHEGVMASGICAM